MNPPASFRHCTPTFPGHRQRGIALVVGLVILVILALLGTTAYSVATQEERMAGNARDHARAFQAAELALRECENQVLKGPIFAAPGSAIVPGMLTAPTNGTWTGDSKPSTWQAYARPPKTWTPANFNLNGEGPTAPVCIAEDFERGTKLNWSTTKTLIQHSARVTAVGYGITTGAKVTLVSYVNYFSTN